MIIREPNTHMHVPCIHKLARKSYMVHVTWKYSCWNYLIQLFLIFTLISFDSFSFLCFPLFNVRVLQEYSKCERVRVNRERSKLKLIKRISKRILSSLLLLRSPFSTISSIFPSISLSCKHVTFHLPFLLFSFIFISKIPINVFFLFRAFDNHFPIPLKP